MDNENKTIFGIAVGASVIVVGIAAYFGTRKAAFSAKEDRGIGRARDR